MKIIKILIFISITINCIQLYLIYSKKVYNQEFENAKKIILKQIIIDKLEKRKLSKFIIVEITYRKNNIYKFKWIDGKWYLL